MQPVPSAVTLTRLFQDAVLHFVQALEGFMGNVPNPVPGGPTIAVPVYPAFQDPEVTSPACIVSLKPAAHDFGVGESWDDVPNATTGLPSFAIYVPDSRMECVVYAKLPGMATYLADALYSGVVGALTYALNPLSNEVVEGAVGKRIAESGVTVVGLAEWAEVESDPEAKRPYGQQFSVHVVFRVNLDLMWAGGASTVGSIKITQDLDSTVPITRVIVVR